MAWALALFTSGLFVQLVLADGALAPTIAAVFGAPRPPGLVDSWLGLISLSGQCVCAIGAFVAITAGLGQCLGSLAPKASRSAPAEAVLRAVSWARLALRWEVFLAVELVLFRARAPNQAAEWRLLRGLVGGNRDAVPLLPTSLIVQTIVAAVAGLMVCAQLRRCVRRGPMICWPEWAVGGVWGSMLFMLVVTRRW